MAAGLRRLSPREAAIVGPFAAQHDRVVGFEMPISDDSGAISAPLLRLPLLARLEMRGVISAQEAAAGEKFHMLFRIGSLDPLRAGDMARTPVTGSRAGDLSGRAEHCRRRVSQAMTALGGAASPAASAVWSVCGLQTSVREWALATRRPHQLATGILIGGLAALAAHFAGVARQRRA